MMKIRKLPDLELLQDLYEYHPDGYLVARRDLCWKQYERKKGERVGYSLTTKNKPYEVIKIENSTWLVHRIIYYMVHGSIDDGMQVDHIDRDKTNNRIENLRLVTNTENQHNRNLHRNNVSGKSGVSYDKLTRCWHARIYHKGKEQSLGFFPRVNDAILARQEAERKYW